MGTKRRVSRTEIGARVDSAWCWSMGRQYVCTALRMRRQQVKSYVIDRHERLVRVD